MRWDWFVFTCAVMGFALLAFGAGSLAGETHRVEPDFWQEDSYTIRDESGRAQGRIERDFWQDDSYVVEDDSGRTRGRIERDNFWRDER